MEGTDTYELTYTEGFLEQLEKHENSGQKDVLKKIEKLFSDDKYPILRHRNRSPIPLL